jgi:hypothetical protein
VPQVDHAGHRQGDERRSQQGVGDAAVVLESSHRATERPQDIQIGGLGRKSHGQGRIGGTAVEAGPSKTGSGEQVGDWFHGLMRD